MVPLAVRRGYFSEIFRIDDPLCTEVAPIRVDLPSGRFPFLALHLSLYPTVARSLVLL